MSRTYNSRKGSKHGHIRKDDWDITGMLHKHIRQLQPGEKLRNREYGRWKPHRLYKMMWKEIGA